MEKPWDQPSSESALPQPERQPDSVSALPYPLAGDDDEKQYRDEDDDEKQYHDEDDAQENEYQASIDADFEWGLGERGDGGKGEFQQFPHGILAFSCGTRGCLIVDGIFFEADVLDDTAEETGAFAIIGFKYIDDFS